MCVFTDKIKRNVAFALVPIVAINVYVGSKMLTRTSKDIDIDSSFVVEEVTPEDLVDDSLLLDVDDTLVSTDVISEEEIVQTNDGEIVLETELLSEFECLDKLYEESGLDVDTIINSYGINDELYVAALYKKAKSCGLSDDLIYRELQNIVVYGTQATCMSAEEWLNLFGNLVGTISEYDNVVDYYYPLAKYVHLYSCDLEHDELFFDDNRISCLNIQELYNLWNPYIDIRDYFTDIINASDNQLLIGKMNRLLSSGLSFEELLNELENVYVYGMDPTGYDDSFVRLLSHTVDSDVDVCDYYYDLACYVHCLWCDFNHEIDEYGKYNCDVYKLVLE